MAYQCSECLNSVRFTYSPFQTVSAPRYVHDSDMAPSRRALHVGTRASLRTETRLRMTLTASTASTASTDLDRYLRAIGIYRELLDPSFLSLAGLLPRLIYSRLSLPNEVDFLQKSSNCSFLISSLISTFPSLAGLPALSFPT